MKKSLFLLTILLAANNLSYSQNSAITRGAEPGELYLTGFWYGIGIRPFYDTVRIALFRLTENGKKLTIQYDVDGFEESVGTILADATSGALYSRRYYSKGDEYLYTALWASFDYGKNWIFREQNIGYSAGINTYHVANVEGLIYRWDGGRYYKSVDYGYTFSESTHGTGGTESGLQNGEAFSVWDINPPWSNQAWLRYTCDFGENYLEIPIDTLYVRYSSGVYRGGLPGEVYVSSRFPDWTYHFSFSADTGYTFRKVFVSETCSPYGPSPAFMTDREPGVFYIIRGEIVTDQNPWGDHLKLCIEYYRDYGETLVDIFCHNVHKNYKNEVGIEELRITNCELQIYPNPTNGALHVTSDMLQVTNVEVFDIYGKRHVSRVTSNEMTIDISHLHAGIYFLRLTTNSGVVTKKVIKL